MVDDAIERRIPLVEAARHNGTVRHLNDAHECFRRALGVPDGRAPWCPVGSAADHERVSAEVDDARRDASLPKVIRDRIGVALCDASQIDPGQRIVEADRLAINVHKPVVDTPERLGNLGRGGDDAILEVPE